MKKLLAIVLVFFSFAPSVFGAVTFLDPGGDATFGSLVTNLQFWSNSGSGMSLVTDFVHGGHIKSTKFNPNSTSFLIGPGGTLTDSGGRVSFYVYLVALPTGTATIARLYNSAVGARVSIRLTSAGVLQLWSGATTAQIGSNGATLATGQWYRISVAFTVTSTTVNRFEAFVNGVSSISITNATIAGTGINRFDIGNINGDLTLDTRMSDIYVEQNSSLTDTGDVWVTAKRPVSNGTTNGFTTQIGSGGSGYGSGHAPQVNERPISTTNGWSMVGAGSAVTEEYSVEGASVGDIDISTATIVDYMGWFYAKSGVGETASMIVGGNTFNKALTTSNSMFIQMAGSATYPTGGTDIGIITTTALTTVSLYETGVVVAYIPAAVVTPNGLPELFLGVGKLLWLNGKITF